MSNGQTDYSGAINSLTATVNKLQGEVGTVHDRISTIDGVLNKHGREISHLNDNVNEIKRDVMIIDEHLKSLMASVSKNFEVFQNTMQHVLEETKTGNQILEQNKEEISRGNKQISENIRESTEASNRGLKKVSSGVAMVEVIQGKASLTETNVAISRAVKEIKDRYYQALAAMEEKQNVYDRHFEETLKGFENQLKLIADHIYELEQKCFADLHTLYPDPGSEMMFNTLCLDILQKKTADRTALLREKLDQLDLKSLAVFKELWNELKNFIEDDSYFKFEQEAASEEDPQDLPAFFLPVNMVSVVDTASGAADKLQVYCLESESEDCYAKPVPDMNLRQLYQSIESTCSTVNKNPSQVWDKNSIETVLKEGLKNLNKAGILNDDHLDLIQRHLDNYELKHLEF